MESPYVKFNSGVWSEVLKGRHDLDNYRSAARTCDNFIPNRYGSIDKRAGTQHLGYAKNDDKTCVLYPFQFSVTTKFVLEFGDQYVRFWSNDQKVADSTITGRYVRLELEGEEKRLHAAEVEVYDTGGTNLALSGTATQSSVSGGRIADGAIDTVRIPENAASLEWARTNLETDPWWEVDLGSEQSIAEIQVWLREEAKDQMDGFKVLILDNARATVWETTVNGTATSSIDHVFSFNAGEVVTPYLEENADGENELYQLQMRAINDVVYIVHPNHPVGKLTRLADDNWTYAVADLDGPYVDPDVNPTEVKLTPDGTTGPITITASGGNAFTTGHVGSELRLKYLVQGRSVTFFDRYSYYPASYLSGYSSTYDQARTWNAALTNWGTSGTKYRRAVENNTPEGYYTFSTCIQDYDPSTAWSTPTSYSVDDLVTQAGDEYVCLEAHTSGTFGPDLSAGKWRKIVTPADAPSYFSPGVVCMEPETVTGEWSLKTTGNWKGEWWIQRSIDDGVTWSTIKVLSSDNDANYLVEEDEQGEEVQIRVLAKRADYGGWEYESVVFNVLSYEDYGVATVNTYNSATSVDATVTETMPAITEAVSWQESAFSPRQGYPRSIALFDNRLVMAGTKKKPQAFFYSGINEYENYLSGTLADSPFFVETLSDDQSAVQWISAQRELFIGTASVEGVLTTRKQDEAQSPENLPIVRWHDSMGSAQHPAMPIRDSLLTLQRGRTTLNVLSYSLERDGYSGEEVSLLCPHLFHSGILQMTHTREPYTGVYVVTEDGTICHMVYEPALQVTAWCEFSTNGGTYESVCVLPGSGDEDLVYAVVRRSINGTVRRHIEKFVVGNTTKQRENDFENLWYLDNAIKVTGTAMTSVSGLEHLEGENITVLADGAVEQHRVVGGSITLNSPADTVIAGIPVTSTFEPLDLEAQGTLGHRKQLHQSRLMLYRSMGGQIATDGKDYQTIIYHTAGELMDTAIPLKDGFTEIFHESSHGRQKFFRIQHDEPFPFTLQAVIQEFKPNAK